MVDGRAPDALVPGAGEDVAVAHRQHAHIVLVPLQRAQARQRLAVPHLRAAAQFQETAVVNATLHLKMYVWACTSCALLQGLHMRVYIYAQSPLEPWASLQSMDWDMDELEIRCVRHKCDELAITEAHGIPVQVRGDDCPGLHLDSGVIRA